MPEYTVYAVRGEIVKVTVADAESQEDAEAKVILDPRIIIIIDQEEWAGLETAANDNEPPPMLQ